MLTYRFVIGSATFVLGSNAEKHFSGLFAFNLRRSLFDSKFNEGLVSTLNSSLLGIVDKGGLQKGTIKKKKPIMSKFSP